MPNHVHLIAVPQSPERAANWRSARSIGVTREWSTFAKGGEAICGRDGLCCFVLDEPYVLTAARYVELNPAAGLADAQPLSVGAGPGRPCARTGRRTRSARSPAQVAAHLGVGFSRGSFGKRTSNSRVLTSKPYLSATRSFCRRSKKTRILRRQKPGPKPRPR